MQHEPEGAPEVRQHLVHLVVESRVARAGLDDEQAEQLASVRDGGQPDPTGVAAAEHDRKALLRWVVAWPSLLVLATALPLGMLLGHRWWEHEATILGLQRRVSVAWSLDALAIGVPLLVAVVFAGMLGHRRSESDALRAE